MKRVLRKLLLLLVLPAVFVLFGFDRSGHLKRYSKRTFFLSEDVWIHAINGKTVILFDDLQLKSGRSYIALVTGQISAVLPAKHTTACDPKKAYTPTVTCTLSLLAPFESATALNSVTVSMESCDGLTLADYTSNCPQPVSFQHQFTVAASGVSERIVQVGIENACKLACQAKGSGSNQEFPFKAIVHKNTMLELIEQDH